MSLFGHVPGALYYPNILEWAGEPWDAGLIRACSDMTRLNMNNSMVFSEADQEVVLLEQQAQEIIDDILSDTASGEAEARRQLEFHVLNNAGNPRRALLMHLLSVER